jgi:CheY-like chemotaxis protein
VNPKILLVDDDESALSAIYRNFRKQYEVDIATDGELALQAMEAHGPYAVVVADLAMPRMNGIDFLQRASELAPDTVRIMLTGHLGAKTTIEAINQGHVFRFLAKPCEHEDLALAIRTGVEFHQLIQAERADAKATLRQGLRAMGDILALALPEGAAAGRTLADRARRVAQLLGEPDGEALATAGLFLPLVQLCAGAPGRSAARILEGIPHLEKVVALLEELGPEGSGTDPFERPLAARILRALADLHALEAAGSPAAAALEALQGANAYDPSLLAALAKVLPAPL